MDTTYLVITGQSEIDKSPILYLFLRVYTFQKEKYKKTIIMKMEVNIKKK